MRVILRRVESLGGLNVVMDESREIDRITLGRGTDQDVQLPDMRVTLAHAEIRVQSDGACRLTCHSENPVWVNGRPITEGTLKVGDVANFGRFRVHVRQPPPDADLVLEIEEHLSTRQVEAARKARVRMSLSDAGLRKRRLAWGLAALVILPLLVLPAALRYASSDGGKSLDTIWQAGPPSAAHSGFVENCAACHQTPFEPVQNSACLDCHKQQAHHSDHPQILDQAMMTDTRCGTCHLEHNGRDALIARKTELCTDCHADPAERFAAAQLTPVSRFDGDHPAFTLSLPAWKDDKATHAEVAQATPQGTAEQSGPLREVSHLKYPHEKHLVAEGVNSPDGKRVLECVTCHRPMGTSFAPIRMEDHCLSCHQLDFDPDVPGRRLPHRRPGEVAAIILDHYARMALTGGVQEPAAPEAVRLLRRPGQALRVDEREAAMGWAQGRAQLTMEDVFSRRVCVVCHEVERTEDPLKPWDVHPVALTSSFLTGARFDHAAHRTEECSRCHEAKTSKESADVLIPPLANCRQCHGDPGAGGGLLGTACVDCHGFHIAEKMYYGSAPPETK